MWWWGGFGGVGSTQLCAHTNIELDQSWVGQFGNVIQIIIMDTISSNIYESFPRAIFALQQEFHFDTETVKIMSGDPLVKTASFIHTIFFQI